MTSHSEIQQEAAKITHQAELATPKDLQAVHKELQNDMHKYSAQDYGKLLNGIEAQNDKDKKANDHLPTLVLHDSGSGVRDSVDAKYNDGTTATASGQQQQGMDNTSSGPGNASTGAGAGADVGSAAGGGTPPPGYHYDATAGAHSDAHPGPTPPSSGGNDAMGGSGGSGGSGKSGAP
jgi:hypothetical protein